MHELAHMYAHTAQVCTFNQAQMHTQDLNVLSLSLSQCLSLGAVTVRMDGSDLPCLVVSCDLSCEISDTQTDACLFEGQTLTPGSADGRQTDRRTERMRERE